jgi:hypothetical protein
VTLAKAQKPANIDGSISQFPSDKQTVLDVGAMNRCEV